MKNDITRNYYHILKKKKNYLFIKRLWDVVISTLLLILSTPIMLGAGIAVYLEDKEKVFFCQTRVKQYGEQFTIYKFRTMKTKQTGLDNTITTENDLRITAVGRFLRRYRLDELPQLFNIIKGDMSFVGPRPEIPQYVDCYTDEMRATLLLPVGLTSQASIDFRNESQLLTKENVHQCYLEKILPAKMERNIRYLSQISGTEDIKVFVKTIITLLNS